MQVKHILALTLLITCIPTTTQSQTLTTLLAKPRTVFFSSSSSSFCSPSSSSPQATCSTSSYLQATLLLPLLLAALLVLSSLLCLCCGILSSPPQPPQVIVTNDSSNPNPDASPSPSSPGKGGKRRHKRRRSSTASQHGLASSPSHSPSRKGSGVLESQPSGTGESFARTNTSPLLASSGRTQSVVGSELHASALARARLRSVASGYLGNNEASKGDVGGSKPAFSPLSSTRSLTRESMLLHTQNSTAWGMEAGMASGDLASPPLLAFDPEELPEPARSKWMAAHPLLWKVVCVKVLLLAAILCVIVTGFLLILASAKADDAEGDAVAALREGGRNVELEARSLSAIYSQQILRYGAVNATLANSSAILESSILQAAQVGDACRDWADLSNVWDATRNYLGVAAVIVTFALVSVAFCALAINGRSTILYVAAASSPVLLVLAVLFVFNVSASIVVSDLCEVSRTPSDHAGLDDFLTCANRFVSLSTLSNVTDHTVTDHICELGLDLCKQTADRVSTFLPSPCYNSTSNGVTSVGCRPLAEDPGALSIDTAVADFGVWNGSVCLSPNDPTAPASPPARACVRDTPTLLICSIGTCESQLSLTTAQSLVRGLSARTTVQMSLSPAISRLVNCSFIDDVLKSAQPHLCTTGSPALERATIYTLCLILSVMLLGAAGICGGSHLVPLHQTRSHALDLARNPIPLAGAQDEVGSDEEGSAERKSPRRRRRSSRSGSLQPLKPIAPIANPLSRRESGLARRESGLARRESGLARRESGLTRRESSRAGGGGGNKGMLQHNTVSLAHFGQESDYSDDYSDDDNDDGDDDGRNRFETGDPTSVLEESYSYYTDGDGGGDGGGGLFEQQQPSRADLETAASRRHAPDFSPRGSGTARTRSHLVPVSSTVDF